MLRGLDLRLLDQQIQLYERSILPPQLSDFAIHTGRESDGREGRFRFYSITGYVERCLEDGLQVPENVVSKVDETLAGDWASPEGLARFRTLEQLDACTVSSLSNICCPFTDDFIQRLHYRFKATEKLPQLPQRHRQVVNPSFQRSEVDHVRIQNKMPRW